MSTQITWTVEQLEVKPSEDGHTNVVVTAHWRCTGVDGDFLATVYSSTAMGPIQEEFTPFDQLTQEQVLSWIYGQGVDKEATEAAVQQQIDNQANPPVVKPPLPWAA